MTKDKQTGWSEDAGPPKNPTPEDVASLYAQVDLQGTTYRDFSAARRAYRAARIGSAAGFNREAVPDPKPGPQRDSQTAASSPSAEKPALPLSPVSPLASSPVVWPSGPRQTLEMARPRWRAVRDVIEERRDLKENAGESRQQQAHISGLALFSLAGGVGKTSLAAALGRVLSSLGERSLLVDTAAYGLLPFYFGAQDSHPGIMSVFGQNGGQSGGRNGISGSTPVNLLLPDPETCTEPGYPGLRDDVMRASRGANRLILDITTAAVAMLRELLPLVHMVLVPIVPDLSSVVSVARITEIVARMKNEGSAPAKVFFVLNQFDPALVLHREMKEMLRRRLGERLLPVEIRHSPLVSEALAEGMTVLDYAPQDPITQDYQELAAWLRDASGLAAPAAGRERRSGQ